MIVDCEDPERLAAFWGGLLGRSIGERTGPYLFLETGRSGGYGLGFQRVDERKTRKNRIHPDLICDDAHATAARVEELGGRREQGYERGGFLVMADPEGNEFCLLAKGPLGMDDHGNVHYLAC